MNIPLSDGINVKWVNVESINPAEEIHNKPRVNVAEYERGKMIYGIKES